MSNGIKVKKRDGRIESLDLEKMHVMVQEACEGLAGVSASQVEMQSGIQFMMALPPTKSKRSSSKVRVTSLTLKLQTISS